MKIYIFVVIALMLTRAVVRLIFLGLGYKFFVQTRLDVLWSVFLEFIVVIYGVIVLL